MMRKKKDHNEINYWQSNTDLMTALVLVLLLIIMLLILYLMQIPENDKPEQEKGDNYNIDNEYGDEPDDPYHQPDEGDDDEEEDGEDDGGGEGGGTDIGTDPEFKFEYPLPSSSGREWNKAAVYATIVDEETGRAIREEGVTFELYEEQIENDGGALRFLNTYYPVKIEFRNYETTKEGVFYLPEKIEEGHYYFKQITELEGYDFAEAVHFDVDDIYDWPDPFVVSIEIPPAKNIIPITIEDAETHEPLSDGTFAVIAAEDIITADKTVRYAKNETADTVTFDKKGYGESKELYLGNYTVVQKKIPKYYASVNETNTVEVKKKDGSKPEALKYLCGKTKINLKLTDNLYTNLRLEGAKFALECKSNPRFTQYAETDANGEIVFTNLEKNSTYSLKEITAPGEYRFKDSGLDIFVDENGRIEEEAEASYDLTNYIVRVSVGVKDMLFGKWLSDVNLVLYDSKGTKISTWTANGSEKMFENIPEGSYYVLVNGDKEKKYEFEVKDQMELHEVEISILTMENIAVAAAGVCIVVISIFGIIKLLTRRKKSGDHETGEKINSGE